MSQTVSARVRLASNKASVLIEFSSLTNQISVTVETHKPYTMHNAMFSEYYLADILAALTIGMSESGVEHIDRLPDYCPCPACVGARAELLARKIQEARDAKS